MQLTFIAILITTNLFSIAVIIWTISQPEFKQAWASLTDKVVDSVTKSYSDQDILDCIHEYYKLIDQLKDCSTMDDIRHCYIEMQIFEHVFVGLVPELLYKEYVRKIHQCHAIEADRVIQGQI